MKGDTGATLRDLAASQIAVVVGEPVDEPNGWVRIELDIPGGAESAADVVAALARADVRVARCERMALSLADLLERTLQRYRRESHV